jgi:hypothetical protein
LLWGYSYAGSVVLMDEPLFLGVRPAPSKVCFNSV